MIVTHATVKGAEHRIYFKRLENPLRLIIERNAHRHGDHRMLVGTLTPFDSLETLYTLVAPLLYGSFVQLENWQRAELENLIRPMLREELPRPS